MRRAKKWLLLVSVTLLSLWAGAQVTVTNELLPWVSDPDPNGNIVVVWQELLAPRRNDLFQIPVSLLPTPNVGFRVRSINIANGTFSDLLVVPNPTHISPPLRQFAGRPQINSDRRWVVFYAADGQVYVTGDNDGDGLIDEDPFGDANGDDNPDDDNDGATDEDPTALISYTGSYTGWLDGDNDSIRDGAPPPSALTSVLPAMNGNGRIVAFLSRDPTIHDPDGDGDPDNNTPPNPAAPPAGLWLLYIHDRDADGNGTFDEARVGATTTRFLNVPGPNAPYVRLTEVRLSLDATGSTLAFSVFTGTAWQLYMADWQSGTVNLIATSNAPLSAPSVVGSRLAFSSVSPFLITGAAQPSPPGVWMFDVTLGAVPVITPGVGIITNGVSGAPMLSRDGLLLSFHSTATRYQRFGVDPTLQPFVFDLNNDGVTETPLPDRNGVDDVFVFNLTTGLPIWSTLLVRGSGAPPITLFEPCVNPALPSSIAPPIAFQQIVNGASVVRVVNRATNMVLR